MDARYGSASEIQRNAIRLAVVQGRAQPVPRRDAGLAQQPSYITTAKPHTRKGAAYRISVDMTRAVRPVRISANPNLIHACPVGFVGRLIVNGSWGMSG